MAELRVISINDHQKRRDRAQLLADMAILASSIADELLTIDARLRALRAQLEALQQGGVDPT
jgi:hypothetical protein